MARISRVSSASSSRIHSNYVHRSRTVNRAESVEIVKPVPKTKNQTAYSSGNYLIYSDAFYESLDNIREEYRKFYYNHREFEQSTKANIDENFLEKIKKIIQKYNKAINSLNNLDKSLGSNYMENIKNTLELSKSNLKTIGIEITKDCEMKLDEEVLLKGIKDVDIKESIINSFMVLMIKLYKDLKNIKLGQSINLNDTPYNNLDISNHIAGILIDSVT